MTEGLFLLKWTHFRKQKEGIWKGTGVCENRDIACGQKSSFPLLAKFACACWPEPNGPSTLRARLPSDGLVPKRPSTVDLNYRLWRPADALPVCCYIDRTESEGVMRLNAMSSCLTSSTAFHELRPQSGQVCAWPSLPNIVCTMY